MRCRTIPMLSRILLIASVFSFFIVVGVWKDGLYAQNKEENDGAYTNEQGKHYVDGSLQTANEFMERVAEKYASFEDFQANIEITDKSVAKGEVYAKPPNKMRINFSDPADQVIVSDGAEFFVYIPQQNVVLNQKKLGETGAESFVMSSGLDQLRKRYVASYVDTPRFVRMNEESRLKVMKIRMRWRSTKQNFRELMLFIGKDLLIYRVDAITYNMSRVRFDFSNIRLNKGIPDARFTYDPPATANVIENFLFEEKQE